jgi:hypothetical protein
MAKTIRCIIIDALEARGCRRVAGSTRKYTVLARSKDKSADSDRHFDYYYVGKSGALRTGRTVADSVSLTGTACYNMLVKGRPQ